MSDEDRLEALIKHINLVQYGCKVFSKKYEPENPHLALRLIANGQIHDNSKFYGIEWKYLNEETAEENPELFREALEQHVSSNPHHPEYWPDIKQMPDEYVLEMIADWHARSEEFGSDLKDWFETVGIPKYKLAGTQLKFIASNVNYIYNFLFNKRFGLLTVLKKTKDKSGKLQWICMCDCGEETVAYQYDLRNGKKQSCGCAKLAGGENSASWKGFGKISGKSWGGIKRSAAIRNIEFTISIEEAWDLFEDQMERCALSGVKLDFPKKSTDKAGASLDRIDCAKGYLIGNVQWVHPIVNYMKHTLSQEDFTAWCKKISDYQDTLVDVPQNPDEYNLDNQDLKSIIKKEVIEELKEEFHNGTK